MNRIIDEPFVVLIVAVMLQWGAAFVGDWLRRYVRPLAKDERQDIDTVLGVTLTLLALIIGFSFSMAVSRYDQRKTYEEAEANAIGTEFVRADLLPADAATRIRALLVRYTDQRIAFYRQDELPSGADVAKLQAELWSAVAGVATVQANPVTALAIAGMNDVLNAEGYTQAAWWNRIPVPAWSLMALIAIVANGMLGYHDRKAGLFILLVLPVVVSISFFLIADIDSPAGGVIRVVPQNLLAVAQSMTAREFGR